MKKIYTTVALATTMIFSYSAFADGNSRWTQQINQLLQQGKEQEARADAAETLVSQYQQQIAGFQEHAQSKDASLSNLQQQIAGFQDHAQSKDANLSNLRQTYSAYQTEATGTITRLQRDLEDARNRAPQVVTQTRVVTQKIPVLVRPTIRPYKLRHGQSVYPRGGRGNFALSSGNGYDVSAVGAGRASQWARQQVRQQVRQRSGRRVHRVGSFHRRSIK